MAQENITVNLPVSGVEATIKGFIPHKVHRRIQSIFIGKQKIDVKGARREDGKDKVNEQVLANMEITGDDSLEMDEVLVKGLTTRIGEHYAATEPLSDIIDDMAEPDYRVLSEAAGKVYREFQEKTSPKDSKAGSKATANI